MAEQGAYTLSYHWFGRGDPENHLDLFLAIDATGPLIQYSRKRHDRGNKMYLGKPHRRLYLEYQGAIAGDRGRVKILRRGKYSIPPSLKEQPGQTIRLKCT